MHIKQIGGGESSRDLRGIACRSYWGGDCGLIQRDECGCVYICWGVWIIRCTRNCASERRCALAGKPAVIATWVTKRAVF